MKHWVNIKNTLYSKSIFTNWPGEVMHYQNYHTFRPDELNPFINLTCALDFQKFCLHTTNLALALLKVFCPRFHFWWKHCWEAGDCVPTWIIYQSELRRGSPAVSLCWIRLTCFSQEAKPNPQLLPRDLSNQLSRQQEIKRLFFFFIYLFLNTPSAAVFVYWVWGKARTQMRMCTAQQLLWWKLLLFLEMSTIEVWEKRYTDGWAFNCMEKIK